MKFANDPFWVRLRWIFFILFWALWIGMLVGAIMIIIGAPKCSAPTPLSWYEQGPLVLLSPETEQQPSDFKAIGAKGVIYKLNPDETYLVHTADVKDKIKKVVDQFNAQNINVIVDITPNFVGKDDELLQKALANSQSDERSAFIWYEGAKQKPNWLAIPEGPEGSAWNETAPGKFILSQFGKNRFDLQLSDKFAKEKLKGVLTELLNIGVKGFRFANAKHFIIVSKDFEDEEVKNAEGPALGHTLYKFWTHKGSTYLPGLGDLLHEFSEFVKNKTNKDAFISVTDNIEQLDPFYLNGTQQFGIELPIYGLLPHTLAGNALDTTKTLHTELKQITNTSKPQWIYDNLTLIENAVGLSEYHAFIALLPGVPVATLDAFQAQNLTSYLSALQEMRTTPSYMHGSFDSYVDNDIIAYTR